MRKIHGLNYIFGIIVLAAMAIVTYYSQNLSPQLIVFFGFVTGYLAAVLVLFWILGRVGA
jgi:xanthine/uracil permease